MAKQNNVHLFAQVLKTTVATDEEGMYTRGMMLVNTIRGLRKTGEKQLSLRYDPIWVLSANPSIIQRIANLKQYDLVYLKGVFTTKNVNKSNVCPHCGKKTTRKGTMEFITPIHIIVYRRDLMKDESTTVLQENIEISNEAEVIGTLTKDPQFFVTPSNIYRTSYSLVVKRKFRITEDNAEIKSDYPKIRSFGKIASSDALALREGSLVFVSGVLQSRTYQKQVECENCEGSFEVSDSSLEIVPYSVEYLKNYRTRAEIEADKEMEDITAFAQSEEGDATDLFNANVVLEGTEEN